MEKAMGFLLLAIPFQFIYSNAEEAFDVRQHLSTATRYGASKGVAQNSNYLPSTIPHGCTPIHLNLLARHGTRNPTEKRIEELDNLAAQLKKLLCEAEGHNLSLLKVPSWLRRWESPWKGKKGGELISKGEDELYDIGIRIAKKFPVLFKEEYHSDIYTINATQVPRVSASAVAFGMGLFSGRGSLGAGGHRAFVVTTQNRASDIWLSFFYCCQKYKELKKKHIPCVDKRKEPILDGITSALTNRYGLNFTRSDTSSLWFLCKQEASLLDITDQACGLFNHSEIALLEWTDDLELFILKGYGNPLNYRMGVALLEDVVQSMEKAIKAQEVVEKDAPVSYEKARLCFAHAETVVPFSCLLGLFLEGSEFQQIQREEPLEPPKPPENRNWRGSTVTPFAGNNMLVLYSCPVTNSSEYFVQVLHNEDPIPLPGCNGSDFCPFKVFKESIVDPHLTQDYNTVCTTNLEKPEQKPSVTSKLSHEEKRADYNTVCTANLEKPEQKPSVTSKLSHEEKQADYNTGCTANLEKPEQKPFVTSKLSHEEKRADYNTVCTANLEKPEQKPSVTSKLSHEEKQADYNTVCTANLEKPEQKPSVASKLSLLFHWLFGLGNDDKQSHKDEL